MDFKCSHQLNSSPSFILHKTFPNNYTSLTLRTDFMLPQGKPICMEGSFNSSCTYISHDHDIKFAGMRIFATIMLNAWRRRREEVKRLMLKVEDLKKGSIKAQNQIHVYNTLFRVEQKRNDELTCQLKNSMDSINQAKSSCESLTTSIISLKADRALLEQELQNKYKEIDALNVILGQTKSDLFRSMVEQRNLQSSLCQEQRTVQYLENQKNKLINELCELGSENRKSEDKYGKELLRKEQLIKHANERMKKLEVELIDLRDKEHQMREFKANDLYLRNEIELLQKNVINLQTTLDKTLGNRLRVCWRYIIYYQKTSLELAHLIAFYLLPAMPPPPKLTITSKHDCL